MLTTAVVAPFEHASLRFEAVLMVQPTLRGAHFDGVEMWVRFAPVFPALS
jgi:hypothetical protein